MRLREEAARLRLKNRMKKRRYNAGAQKLMRTTESEKKAEAACGSKIKDKNRMGLFRMRI
jgi:hypothetical protein